MGMYSSAPIANRLPVDPIARRLPDGRIIRVIRYNRHLIAMPKLAFPATSWQATMSMPWIVKDFGHPEYLALQWRIEQLLSQAGELPELSDLDVIRINDLSDLLRIVIHKVAAGIASRWPAEKLLPIFGNWPTFSEVQGRFRVRNGRQEVYDAIGFLHSVSLSLDLIEARLHRPAFANGNVPFDFRGGV